MLKYCPVCKKDTEQYEYTRTKTLKNGEVRVYPANRCKIKHYLTKDQSKHQRKHKYGLTDNQFQEILKNQGYCCAICSCDLALSGLHVDHNHISSKVRGILCPSCNKGLGHFNDDPYLLKLAAQYLEVWNA